MINKLQKLSLSAVLLLAGSTAWAGVEAGGKLTSLDQLDNTQAFTLTVVRGTFTANDGGTALARTETKNATDPKQQFAFVKKTDDATTYYLYNISAGKFVGGNGGNVTLSSEGDEFELVATPRTANGVQYDWMIKRPSDSNYLMLNGGSNPVFDTWSTADDGDVFIIGDAVDATAAIQNAVAFLNATPITVTYNVTFNGTVVASAEGEARIGQTPLLPASLSNDLCTIEYAGGEVTAETTEVNFTATWNGPFQFSNGVQFESIDWKNLTIRGTKYVNAVEPEPYTNDNNASEIRRATDEYQWAFLGNPYSVVIINKAGGADKSLKLEENGNFVLRDGQNGYPVTKVAASGHTGFGVIVPGGIIDDNGGKLKIWANGYVQDYGNLLEIADVPEPNYAQYVLSDVGPYVNTTGELFGLREDVLSNDFYTAYNTATTSANKQTYEDLLAWAKEAFTAENLVYPETGYYRVESKFRPGFWLQWEEPANYANNNTGVKFVQNGNTSASSVVRFEKKDGSLNEYAIKIQGKYLGAPDVTGGNANTWNGRTSTQNDTPHYYTFEVKTPGQVTFRGATDGDQNNYSYAQLADGQNNCFVTWLYEGKSEMSVVPVADIDITIGETGYATTYLPFAVNVPEDVTANTGNIIQLQEELGDYVRVETWIVLEDAGSTIPAGTGVVLKGNAGTYKFTIAESAAAVADNDIIGAYLQTASAGQYILAKPEGEKIGFYLTETGTIPANKAFLPATDGEVKAFFFAEDGATGINEVNGAVAEEGQIIYNVAGQRLQKMQNGINIVGGKKVLK